MADDLQDQEELENAKRQWRLWGRWVFLALLIAGAIYLGNTVWTGHVQSQNAKAAEYFENEFLAHAEKNDEAGTLKALQTLQQDYPKSVATAQATLSVADVSFFQKKYDAAVNHLQWLLNTQKDEAIKAVARERLAITYLQQKKYDDALNTLKATVPAEFAAHQSELKGDIYLAQDKKTEAKQAYEEALNKLPENDPTREFIQMKMHL